MDLNLGLPVFTNDEYGDEGEYSRSDCVRVGGLRVFQVNFRSIKDLKRFDLFVRFLIKFPGVYDIVVVGESWIDAGEVGLYSLPGYSAIFASRDGFAGGLVVYVHERLDYVVNESLSSAFFYISLTVQLPPNDVATKFNLHAYYRPSVESNVDGFLDHLAKAIDGDKFGMIAGDVNINVLPSARHSSLRRRYESIVASCGYSIGNNRVTRLDSNALLDHAVFACEKHICIHNSTIHHAMSDHSVVISLIPLPISDKYTILTKTNVDYDKVVSELLHLLDGGSVPQTDDVNELYSYFLASFKSSISKFSVTRSVKVKTAHLDCPYMNDHLEYLIRKMSNLRNKVRRKRRLRLDHSHLDDKLAVLKIEFEKYQEQYKRYYYEDLFRDCDKPKRLWRRIDKLLGKSKRSVSAVSLQDEGRQVEGDQVAEFFNEYFANVGKKLAEAIPDSDQDDLNKFGTLTATPLSLFFEPVTAADVASIIMSMDVDKSPGVDEISVGSLKCCSAVISPFLSDLFNLSLAHGVYPDDLKLAKVIPVYKKGSSSEVGNYRPISVLPAVNKVLETVVQRAVSGFLKQTGFFNARQYGFRDGSGTHTALFELISMINTEIDKGRVVSGLFIDLSKAFDTVIHRLLLVKLEFAGIRGVALDLLRSYLTGRRQVTVCNGVKSEPMGVTVGVPQGGVLSPLLFLVFINDFFELPMSSSPFGFADDTNMFNSSSDAAENLNGFSHDLVVMTEYFRLNKLTLNLSKTKLIHFRKPSVKISNLPVLSFRGVQIEVCSSVKCLGLTLDEFVTWEEHVSNVSSTISRQIGIIKRLRFLPKRILRMIYFSTVHSRLTYCIGVWGSARKSLINDLEVLHRSALKSTHKLPKRFPTGLLFACHFPGVLTVTQMYEMSVCKFVFCCLNDLKHHSVQFFDNSNRYGTRYSYLLKAPKVLSKYGDRSLLCAGPKLFNALPTQIRNSHTLNQFCRSLKAFMLCSR